MAIDASAIPVPDDDAIDDLTRVMSGVAVDQDLVTTAEKWLPIKAWDGWEVDHLSIGMPAGVGTTLTVVWRFVRDHSRTYTEEAWPIKPQGLTTEVQEGPHTYKVTKNWLAESVSLYHLRPECWVKIRWRLLSTEQKKVMPETARVGPYSSRA